MNKTRKTIQFLLGTLCALLLLSPGGVFADFDIIDLPESDVYFKAAVQHINTKDDPEGDDFSSPYNIISVRALDGPFIDEDIKVFQESFRGKYVFSNIDIGDTIIVYWSELNEPPFIFHSHYRTPQIILFFLIFLAVIIALTRLHGVRAIISLALTFAVIIFFVVPQIAAGGNPILISLFGSLVILIVSIFLSHGVKTTSVIAFASSLSTIGLSVIFGSLALHMTKLIGVGGNEAFLLQFGSLDTVNLRGLLLGGMIIGTIGLLDDVSVVQASAVEEIHKANASLGKRELFIRGQRVGREHIISMVNTLFIAYAGAALPLFLFFTFQEHTPIPLWVKLNSDLVVEEVVRSLVGSMVLIFTVPLTTYIAAYVFSKRPSTPKEQ